VRNRMLSPSRKSSSEGVRRISNTSCRSSCVDGPAGTNGRAIVLGPILEVEPDDGPGECLDRASAPVRWRLCVGTLSDCMPRLAIRLRGDLGSPSRATAEDSPPCAGGRCIERLAIAWPNSVSSSIAGAMLGEDPPSTPDAVSGRWSPDEKEGEALLTARWPLSSLRGASAPEFARRPAGGTQFCSGAGEATGDDAVESVFRCAALRPTMSRPSMGFLVGKSARSFREAKRFARPVRHVGVLSVGDPSWLATLWRRHVRSAQAQPAAPLATGNTFTLLRRPANDFAPQGIALLAEARVP